MHTLTTKDKVAILQRLIKKVKSWRIEKSLPVVVLLGSSNLNQHSLEFKKWVSDATKAIAIVFGEHSHYVADFNDIQYSDLLTDLLGKRKDQEAKFWDGLTQATTMFLEMIDDVKRIEEPPVPVIEISSAKATSRRHTARSEQCVFIAHGQSSVWLDVRRFLQEELNLKIVCYESESRTSQSIVPILEKMLDRATFAVIVLTAEDVTADGTVRGRQNVIHEAGLLHGKLGFDKVVILKQEHVEVPSNLAGLQYISFTDNRVEKAFYELQRALLREGVVS